MLNEYVVEVSRRQASFRLTVTAPNEEEARMVVAVFGAANIVSSSIQVVDVKQALQQGEEVD